METYRVLVVDDSAFMRRSISRLIEQEEQFHVVGYARNGLEAIEKIQRLHPHVVTMDVEMPELDGLRAVDRIMRECPVPIVMLSSLTERGTSTTVRALQLGAVDCLHKDDILQGQPYSRSDFFARLEAAALARMSSSKEAQDKPSIRSLHSTIAGQGISPVSRSGIELVVIGCSTGGPAALHSILPKLDPSLPVPVVVVQHMPKGFTKSLAERFDSQCKVHVKEAEDGEPIQKGWVYIAPAGVQCMLERKGGVVRIQLNETSLVETRFRPSVDVALLSAAPIYRSGLLAIVLTGMGNDGTLGCKDVKQYGGKVLAQTEATCVVYGMPKSVVEAGHADGQIPLGSMVQYIHESVPHPGMRER